MLHEIKAFSKYGKCELKEDKLHFSSEREGEVYFQMEVCFREWEEDAFIFMPACAYNGNRFKKVYRAYPPRFSPEEYSLNPELIINKLPSLNPDGSGKIEVTSGDMSVPCIGVFYRQKKEAFFLFTKQQIKEKNIGYTAERGKFIISFPAKREVAYRFDRPDDLFPDSGIMVHKGEELESEFLIKSFECRDLEMFYAEFFKLRKILMPGTRVKNLYTKELWDLMANQKLKEWNEKDYSKDASWGCGGWTGGEHCVFIKKGNEEQKEAAKRVLDFDVIPEHRGVSGFFYDSVKNGKSDKKTHLIRYSAGTLYYLLKNFEITEPKKEWIDCAKECADAFVKLFKTYGKFGTLIDPETGEMLLGCGYTGVGAISALCKCAVFFKSDIYRKTALDAGEYYYREFLADGMTFCGPSDTLCAPDSESAFMLLEAFVNLYELTKEEKWLNRAEFCLHYCSSWVVSYTYKFPKDSEFGRLGINTVGSVFASVQNKHSAPGICVSSGKCIYKIYKYTGNKEYLELIKDIAYFIPQCVSTKERPIFACMPQFGLPIGKYLPEGAINERVNMSDWEYADGVGNVFYSRCWPDNSLLLTYGELMDYDEFKD